MGAYLSEPVTRKESTEDEDERFKYGSSAMQGWRTGMEDAHTVRAHLESLVCSPSALRCSSHFFMLT